MTKSPSNSNSLFIIHNKYPLQSVGYLVLEDWEGENMNTENQKPWLYRSVKSTLSLAFFLEILLSYFMPFSDKGNQIGIGFPYTYLYIQKQGSLNFSPFFSTALNPLRLILNLFFLYLLLKFLSWSWCFLELNRKQN